MDAWDRCEGEVCIEELERQPCYAGLDLSSTTDLTCVALWFPREDGPDKVLLYYWLPEASMHERVRRDRVPYDVWARQGHIELTPGNVVDYSWLEDSIAHLGRRFRIKELAFDPWNATHLVQNLEHRGIKPIPFTQSIKSFAAPTRELEKLVVSRDFEHGGNPVLRWNAANVSVTQDSSGNLKPDKSTSSGRIDGVVALIMALDRCMRQPIRKSKYEQEGLTLL